MKAHARNHNTTSEVEEPFTLQQFLGDRMDKAVSSALKYWNEFVSQYPGQTVDKKFLVNNVALIHRLLEEVIPNVLQDNAMLEDQYQQILESYEIQNRKHLQDLIAVSGSIQVTTSVIETLGDLDSVLDKLVVYGIFMELQESMLTFETDTPAVADRVGNLDELDGDTKLSSPFWLICALLSNDTLSPHLVTHAEYVNLMRGCKNVKQVELKDSALMQSSEVVDGLLSELGLE